MNQAQNQPQNQPKRPPQPLNAAELLVRARALEPVFRAQAPFSELRGKLTDEAFGAMRDAGLLRLLIPECFGGAEANTLQALEVIEALSYADGSAGWVLMATGVCTGIAAACLPSNAAWQLFGNATPVIAGQGAPNGQAVVETRDGIEGFSLSGKWSYGSGILHSDHIHAGAMVMENGAARLRADGRGPEIRTFIVPTSKARMEGNWDVMGLRATGSVNYSITDAFVPEDFTHAPEALHRNQGGNVYSIGIIGMTALGHTGFIIGVGRRMLDELAAFIAGKPPGRGGLLPPISATQSFHEGFGHAEARYRSSRAFIFDAWGDLQKTLDRGDPPGTRQITLIRLALNHATSEIADVCAWAYKTAGGYALRESALQRCFRDVFAGTQHFLVSPTVLQECGRELAGLAKGEAWTLLGLRKPL
ncbi:MAG: acyl-CoA dehydrogenase [Betaproteobacteria bacterium]|nr:acyl-CoA dehydrogenase [Betaproteobacteria bacterium]